MPRPRKQRIYWKDGRAYADFRDFAAWGGRQEALKAPGARAATSNADEAMRLCAQQSRSSAPTRRYPAPQLRITWRRPAGPCA